jgi:hypothetical protein
MFDLLEIGNLYNSAYLGRENDSYVWTETQRTPNTLAQVRFVFNGGMISYIKAGLLDKMRGAYQPNYSGALMLGKICDGILFLDRGDEHYFVVLEVKSSFNEIKKRAINQIPASYVKTKSILNDFVSYSTNDYEEFGLIVSYPYIESSKTDFENNTTVMDYKRKIIGDRNEIITSKYSRLLKEKKSAIFIGDDFEFNTLSNVKKHLLFDTLKVQHCPVDNHCEEATVDLDDVINTLKKSV